MTRSETYRDAVDHLSGSLDLALSGYDGMLRLDNQVRTEHLCSDIDDLEYWSAFRVETAMADLWLDSTASLLAVIEIEALFEGDARVSQLRECRRQLIRSLEQLPDYRVASKGRRPEV
ncbi:MAG TPA: hypothetical protein DDW52_15035 [Planctomycetaceae bacterium]|nr:hypothetical protein [Planctomycetaceae bacterium]